MTASRRQALGLAAAALLLTASQGAQAADAALARAVASEARPAEDRARDDARHPVESLTFWGLKPGQTVIEVSPGGGYWTEILAPYAAATKGRYVAGVADLANPNISEGARKSRADFEARFANATRYGKVEYVGFGATS
jgi:predicted methyltransferase